MINNYKGTIVDEGLEESIIGGLIKNPERIGEFQLAPDHFAFPKTRLLMKAILDLEATSKPVDPLEVSEILEREGTLELAGGMGYIARLVYDTYSDKSLEFHCKQLKDRAIKRQIAKLADDLKLETERAGTSDEVLGMLHERLSDIALQGESLLPKRAGESMPDLYRELLRRKDSDGELLGLSTGLSAVDRALNGLHPGSLYIVAGRPGMGKSVVGLQWACHIALSKQTALFVSLEMPKQELLFRAISNIGRIPLEKIVAAKLAPEEWHWARDVMRQLRSAPLYIDESSSLTLGSLRNRARMLKKKHDLKLIVVDYLTLMRTETSRGESRANEVGAISRGMKALAKELSIPIVLIAQLNRGVEQRVDKRPVMSDLRDSGEIEQDADVVICIYRDEVYDAETPDKGCMELLIRKNRSGPLAMVPLAFMADQVKVGDLEGGLPSASIPQESRARPSRGFRYVQD